MVDADVSHFYMMAIESGLKMDEVLFEKRGAVGLITLNRPKVLNALSHAMIKAMRVQLKIWAADPGIRTVVIRGEGSRAFCSGGDIRALHATSGPQAAIAFWRDEYALNAEIAHFPKPYIALIQGIWMGGGVGVSVHGTYRIADETVVFAMPEVGIGFFPDIGASFFLPRCRGEIGTYLALTGWRINAGDALQAGLLTHFIPSQKWPQLLIALEKGQDTKSLLAVHAVKAWPHAPLADQRIKLGAIFSASTVEEILKRLDADGSDWAKGTAVLMRHRSPTSMKVALREMREERGRSINDCLSMEFRIAARMIEGHDFREGVRAVIVDKDNKPAWSPQGLGGVSDDAVAAYFAPLGEGELSL